MYVCCFSDKCCLNNGTLYEPGEKLASFSANGNCTKTDLMCGQKEGIPSIEARTTDTCQNYLMQKIFEIQNQVNTIETRTISQKVTKNQDILKKIEEVVQNHTNILRNISKEECNPSLVKTTLPPEPTTSTAGNIFYEDSGYKYYKVSVPEGKVFPLTTGFIADTCESVGLKAMCHGSPTCRNTDTSRCVNTPMSVDCGWPMAAFSTIFCSTRDPFNCDQTKGLCVEFVHGMGDACASYQGRWTHGHPHTSSISTPFFALCTNAI